MNIIHTILSYPCFIIGVILGYFSRPILNGWYHGFYYLELRANQELTTELEQLLVKKDS